MADRNRELVPDNWSLVRERALTTLISLSLYYHEHNTAFELGQVQFKMVSMLSQKVKICTPPRLLVEKIIMIIKNTVFYCAGERVSYSSSKYVGVSKEKCFKRSFEQ